MSQEEFVRNFMTSVPSFTNFATPDLCVMNALLYQLSYPIQWVHLKDCCNVSSYTNHNVKQNLSAGGDHM
ncbi:hypothetical protein OUZ56_027297 [Daphnia magna]|uniref:Uncharacterized protein n=1 Tax=Daphnia magna TaxID=35525 RepID=A0ABQ9ZPD3_9CRUS|nr:hypothetical protein OUZ56_027297 [Daphnia magna]